MEIEEFMVTLNSFMNERSWSQFHTLENLAKSISIEAAELLECFQWTPSVSEISSDRVIQELADVLTYCFLLASKLEVDPVEVMTSKLEQTGKKYPIEKSFGRSTKYDQL